jgi:hypothetical protein
MAREQGAESTERRSRHWSGDGPRNGGREGMARPHAGPKTVNREAELTAPTGVESGDLLGHSLASVKHITEKWYGNNRDQVNKRD